MVPVAGIDSCAQHQCFNDYLQLLVFTGHKFTVNTVKCSTPCAPLPCMVHTGVYGYLYIPSATHGVVRSVVVH